MENSPLGTRVSVDKICWDYESDILGILLTVDLRVMDISDSTHCGLEGHGHIGV